MTRLPPPHPHQVVSDWIAAKDIHVLTDSVEKELLDVTWSDRSGSLGYDVCTRRARRQIERLSFLTPRLLDDLGIPHKIQVRVRTLRAYRQRHRFHLYF